MKSLYLSMLIVLRKTGATITTILPPAKMSVGRSCNENEECTSGSCFDSICECRDDDDCLQGHICNTDGRASDPFLCITGYLAVGESCDYPIQCESHSCFESVCECRRDSDCSNDEVCDIREPPFSCDFREAPSSIPGGNSDPSFQPSSHPSYRASVSGEPSASNSLFSFEPSLEPSSSEILSEPPTTQPIAEPSLTPTISEFLSESPSYEPSMHPTFRAEAVVSAYYASWQWYDRNKVAAPANLDFTKIDRVK